MRFRAFFELFLHYQITKFVLSYLLNNARSYFRECGCYGAVSSMEYCKERQKEKIWGLIKQRLGEQFIIYLLFITFRILSLYTFRNSLHIYIHLFTLYIFCLFYIFLIFYFKTWIFCSLKILVFWGIKMWKEFWTKAFYIYSNPARMYIHTAVNIRITDIHITYHVCEIECICYRFILKATIWCRVD